MNPYTITDAIHIAALAARNMREIRCAEIPSINPPMHWIAPMYARPPANRHRRNEIFSSTDA